MKKYSKLVEPKELDFFSIEDDGKGGKQVHINGYTYQGDVDWKYVECIFCIVPLAEFVKGMKEDDEYISNLLSECKQGIKDCTAEEIVAICNEYYDGKEPSEYVSYEDISEEYPCGDYVCGSYPNEEYVRDLFGNDLFAANVNLYDYGMEVVVEIADDDDGYFNVGYRHIGKDDVEWYVENDFEHEVAQDIVTCAAIAKKQGEVDQRRVWIVTHTSISMNDYAANGHTSARVCDTEEKAMAKLKAWKDEELQFAKDEEREVTIYEDDDKEFRMGWCMDSEQLRICVHSEPMNKE